MRHRVYGKKLGRNSNQRTALFKSLVRSLILHESIITTQAKAKAIKGLVDQLISQSKKKSPSSRNWIQAFLPHSEINKKILEDIAPRYSSRVSGFTQIVKLGRRAGDGALLVKMNLIEADKVQVKPKVKIPRKKL